MSTHKYTKGNVWVEHEETIDGNMIVTGSLIVKGDLRVNGTVYTLHGVTLSPMEKLAKYIDGECPCCGR